MRVENKPIETKNNFIQFFFLLVAFWAFMFVNNKLRTQNEIAYSFLGGLLHIGFIILLLRFIPSNKESKVKIIIIGLMFLVAISLLLFKFFHYDTLSTMANYSLTTWKKRFNFYIIGCCLVPILEELFFRGLLFHKIQTNTTGTKENLIRITVTAFIFGLMHLPFLYGINDANALENVLSAFAAGIVFGLLRALTKSYWISTLYTQWVILEGFKCY